MTEKRFTIIYNEHSEMMQYVDNQKEEPNRWAIWNASETAKKLNELNDKSEQLQARNDRQAKQLDRLYRLVEEKDWRTLTDIMDDFKRCEEQLQREWRTYE